jgi:hypothetical protein
VFYINTCIWIWNDNVVILLHRFDERGRDVIGCDIIRHVGAVYSINIPWIFVTSTAEHG